jgi:hypothetical protein
MMRAVFTPIDDCWRLQAGQCTSADTWLTLAALDAYLAENGLRRIPAPRSLDWRVIPNEYPIVEV